MTRLGAIQKLLVSRVRTDEQRVLRDIRRILDDENTGVVLMEFTLHERELVREAEMAVSQKDIKITPRPTPLVLGGGTGIGG